MRTTVTLDPDVAAQLRRDMRERGVSFKQALNDAVRAAAAGGDSGEQFDFPTYDMGDALVDIDNALRVAGELEDEELQRRLAQGR